VRQLRLELALDQAQVEELFALSREEALARLRRQLRFHRLGVALLLLQEAQDRWEAGEADRSFDLAELAFEILLRLGPNQLPVQNDAFAHIWTLFGVEAGFHRPTLADTFFQGAETFLEMGSGDPLAAAVVYRLRGEAQEAAGRRDEAQRAFELAARSYRKGADEEMAEELLRRFRSLESGP
jgi:tetratricopeptide (TPR) repeat protein